MVADEAAIRVAWHLSILSYDLNKINFSTLNSTLKLVRLTKIDKHSNGNLRRVACRTVLLSLNGPQSTRLRQRLSKRESGR